MKNFLKAFGYPWRPQYTYQVTDCLCRRRCALSVVTVYTWATDAQGRRVKRFTKNYNIHRN